ncbi:Uncharacterised protein [Vibrio cholerae]|nr:Uncharacterised protein [Vibrio cholerae]
MVNTALTCCLASASLKLGLLAINLTASNATSTLSLSEVSRSSISLARKISISRWPKVLA